MAESLPSSPSSISLSFADERSGTSGSVPSIIQPDDLELNKIVNLNVGGKRYTTTFLTLTKNPSTVLAKMFAIGEYGKPAKDEQGHYFIDSDGDLFGYILRYLQHDMLPPRHKTRDVYQLAVYFCIDDLAQRLEILPEIFLPQIQDGVFNNSLKQVDEHVKQMLEKAKELSKVQDKADALRIEVCIRNNRNVTLLHKKHLCARRFFNTHMGRWIPIPVDVVLGPAGVDVSEDDYRVCIVNRMAALGYTLRHIDDSNNPIKEPRCVDRFAIGPSLEGCGGRVFTLALEWLPS